MRFMCFVFPLELLGRAVFGSFSQRTCITDELRCVSRAAPRIVSDLTELNNRIIW